jgi:putative acyl-CoA dehydrogenase
MIPTPPIMTATHEVLNQARALENYNAYANNRPLQEAVAQQGAGWAQDWLMARGAEVGSAEWIEHGGWPTPARRC